MKQAFSILIAIAAFSVLAGIGASANKPQTTVQQLAAVQAQLAAASAQLTAATQAVAQDAATIAQLRAYIASSQPTTAPTTAPATQPTTSPTSQPATQPWLGVNVGSNDYWQLCIWADATRAADTFKAVGNSGGSLNANGYPVGNGILWRSICYLLDAPAGNYQVTWTGNAAVNLSTTGPVVYVATGPNSGVLTVTAPIELNANLNPTGLIFIDVTSSDPANPLSNLHIWLPGYAPGQPNAGLMYRTDFTAWLKGRPLRAMEFLHTKSSTEQDWTNRVQPTAWDWTSDGVPHEAVIELAKETASPTVWVNIPIGATADYVTQLATLYHLGLPPPTRIIFETGNENWNTGAGFVCSQLLDAIANGNANSTWPNAVANQYAYDGPVTLNASSKWTWQQTPVGGTLVTDGYTRMARCGASIAAANAALVNAVFADRPGQVQHVFCGCSANPAWINLGLQFLLARDGKHPFQCIGTAPYIVPTVQPGDTVSAVLARMESNITDSVSGVTWQAQQAKASAAAFGASIVNYEGGPYNGTAGDIADQACQNAGIAPVIAGYQSVLKANGVTQHFHFIGIRAPDPGGQGGDWGALPTVSGKLTPLWQALMAGN